MESNNNPHFHRFMLIETSSNAFMESFGRILADGSSLTSTEKSHLMKIINNLEDFLQQMKSEVRNGDSKASASKVGTPLKSGKKVDRRDSCKAYSGTSLANMESLVSKTLDFGVEINKILGELTSAKKAADEKIEELEDKIHQYERKLSGDVTNSVSVPPTELPKVMFPASSAFSPYAAAPDVHAHKIEKDVLGSSLPRKISFTEIDGNGVRFGVELKPVNRSPKRSVELGDKCDGNVCSLPPIAVRNEDKVKKRRSIDAVASGRVHNANQAQQENMPDIVLPSKIRAVQKQLAVARKSLPFPQEPSPEMKQPSPRVTSVGVGRRISWGFKSTALQKQEWTNLTSQLGQETNDEP